MKRIACILILPCCLSCGTARQQATVESDYSSSFLKIDSIFSQTRLLNMEDVSRRGELSAHINIRTFSSPDSLGAQYVVSETNIDLVANEETQLHQERAEDHASGGGSLNAGQESGSSAAEETKDMDRRPFRIPAWVWWVAGVIGAGCVVFKAKDWFKKVG